MIPVELFIFMLIAAGLMFAASLFSIGAEYWIDVVFGILSSVFMTVLTVMFAAGNVGYTVFNLAHEEVTILIQDSSMVFLLAAVCVLFIGTTLFKIGMEVITTYQTGGY